MNFFFKKRYITVKFQNKIKRKLRKFQKFPKGWELWLWPSQQQYWESEDHPISELKWFSTQNSTPTRWAKHKNKHFFRWANLKKLISSNHSQEAPKGIGTTKTREQFKKEEVMEASLQEILTLKGQRNFQEEGL